MTEKSLLVNGEDHVSQPGSEETGMHASCFHLELGLVVRDEPKSCTVAPAGLPQPITGVEIVGVIDEQSAPFPDSKSKMVQLTLLWAAD